MSGFRCQAKEGANFQDKECIRMLNGLEKTLERKVPEKDRRWQVAEELEVYHANEEMFFRGWPVPTNSEI